MVNWYNGAELYITLLGLTWSFTTREIKMDKGDRQERGTGRQPVV